MRGCMVEAAYAIPRLHGSDFDDATELRLQEIVLQLFGEVSDFDWPGREWDLTERGFGGLKATVMFMPLPIGYLPPRYREQWN